MDFFGGAIPETKRAVHSRLPFVREIEKIGWGNSCKEEGNFEPTERMGRETKTL